MEKIIQFVLRNRLLMMIFAVFILAGGYMSYTQLPIDAFPDVSPALVQVFTVSEGFSPEEVEKYVTFPVEASMSGLPRLEEVRSVSNFGLSVVNLYFEEGTDIYFARQVVNERLQEAREQIPEGFGTPRMGPITSGMGLIMFYYLDDEKGQYSLTELRAIQDWLVRFPLQTVPGVTEVLGIGGWEKQYQVVLNPNALLRYKVNVNDVLEKIRANNLNVGAQFIEKSDEQLTIRSVGLTSNIDDIKNIVIKAQDGVPIYLKQLARVQIGGAVRYGLATRNGKGEVVVGQIVKLFGKNSSQVIRDVEQKLVQINEILPPGLKIKPYYEQKTLVEAAVRTVTDALKEAVLLVVFILIVFLGAFRPSLVVATAIPFSVLFAIIGMKYLGISANLMSFGGLAIAIGMMVDGTVVIVENVDRLLRSTDPDEPRIHVVARACLEVLRPITFAVLIIIVVFLPLFTLQGVEGKTFRPLAYTIALAMTGSLFFAITLAPVLAYWLMRRPKKSKNSAEGEQVIWILRMMLKLYRPLVTFFVKQRSAAIGLALFLLLIGALIYPRLGSEFTPRLMEGSIVVRLTMAPSISLTESTRMTEIVERRLMEIPDVSEAVSRVGRGEVGADAEPINVVETIVELRPREEWQTARTQEGIEDVIRQKLSGIPGVLVSITQPIQLRVDEMISGVRAQIAIKLFGEDLDILKKKADEITSVINQIPGAADVQANQISGSPQLLIRVNRHSIARYGINVADVQNVIRTAVGGETAGQFFEGVRRFNILLRFEPEFRNTIEAIKEVLVEAPNGADVPLSQLASFEEIVGPRQITREKGQRFITIQANVVNRDVGSFVKEGQRAIAEQVTLPPGYLGEWGGQFQLQQNANRRLALVMPITLFIIFVLLFSNFNSLKNALLIFLNIPMALVGGIVALWMAGLNLSVPASVGFIALFGIALLNGIVLVTYLNQLLKEGFSVDKASIEGACLRMRPVLMTAFAAALGMLPLLFSSGIGSEVQRPLATVVVGGLMTSTALTLLVIPALYKWFAVDVSAEANLD